MGQSVGLSGWLDEVIAGDGVFILKRLSGNDTLANGSHQAGFYLPKNFILSLFPEWARQFGSNQKAIIRLTLESHDHARDVTATWYNNKFREGGGTRDEARITGFGGAASPLLDPESTGALVALYFQRSSASESARCRAWLAKSPEEEDHMESLFGWVEPGRLLQQGQFSLVDNATPSVEIADSRGSCWMRPDQIPVAWLSTFPSGLELVEHVLTSMPADGLDPDSRLVKRRICEEQAFYSVEEARDLEAVQAGFPDIASFMVKAKSMTQRRLSRSGRSLELHARQIFEEEGLRAGKGYSWQPTTEHGKKPDFLFPSQEAYQDPDFPADRLRMLAVKTTCKDRWRQVINEADRLDSSHLLTLQEGVSERQFAEMRSEGVTLVVPEAICKSFHKSIRPQLMSLAEFIDEVKNL